MNLIHPQKAFSLLEMLLVISLIAILSTLGLTVYQKRANAAKIDLAMIEMQGILQAASAFYLSGSTPNTETNNRWPAYDALSTNMPSYFVPFLPVANNFSGALLNPWGQAYQIDGSLNYKFKVQTATPSAEIAQQLANNLPYGGVDPNDNKVAYAYIPIPGQQVATGIILKEVGIANKDTKGIDIPQDCPANTTPRIITAAHYMRTDLSDISPSGLNGPVDRIVASPVTLLSTEASIINNSTQWKLNTSMMKAKNCDNERDKCEDGAQSGKWNGDEVKAEVLYITYCDPTTPT